MSACFEIVLLSRSLISHSALQSIFSVFGCNVQLKSSKMYWDWSFDESTSTDLIASELMGDIADHIIKHDGVVDETHPIGIFQYREGTDYVNQLWINTAHLSFLDSDVCTQRIQSVCDLLESKITGMLDEWGIKLFAAGSETMFHYSENYADILANSRNLLYSHLY